MPITIGDLREDLSRETMNRVESYANGLHKKQFPCWIVVCAKTDRFKSGQINASIQHYKKCPPKMLGILVWYADKEKGILDFLPDLSFPPDIPLNPADLSTKSSDSFESVAQKGEDLKVLLS